MRRCTRKGAGDVSLNPLGCPYVISAIEMERTELKEVPNIEGAKQRTVTDRVTLSSHLRDEISSLLADALLLDLQCDSSFMVESPPGSDHR